MITDETKLVFQCINTVYIHDRNYVNTRVRISSLSMWRSMFCTEWDRCFLNLHDLCPFFGPDITYKMKLVRPAMLHLVLSSTKRCYLYKLLLLAQTCSVIHYQKFVLVQVHMFRSTTSECQADRFWSAVIGTLESNSRETTLVRVFVSKARVLMSSRESARFRATRATCS